MATLNINVNDEYLDPVLDFIARDLNNPYDATVTIYDEKTGAPSEIPNPMTKQQHVERAIAEYYNRRFVSQEREKAARIYRQQIEATDDFATAAVITDSLATERVVE